MHVFNHVKFSVMSLEKSVEFYKKALGLTEKRRKEGSDGSFINLYLGDPKSNFQLELTWNKGREEPYDLGEECFHLALTSDDMEASHRLHEEMGCIAFENHAMGVYFIKDPDGYWIEIIPEK